MNNPIQSYTSSSERTSSVLTEFFYLFKGMRRAARNMPAEVADLVRQLREVEDVIRQSYGLEICGLDVLEIGVGQLPRQIAYFARQNNVVGIDLDLIPTGAKLSDYQLMLTRNGAQRFVKTVARKALGFDRRFRRELQHALNVASMPRFTLLSMDAAHTTFPDASFDFIYSFNVFEHLPDPRAVLREIKRLLRPGGVVLNHLHLYTCDSGCHDVRILGGARGDLPLWPHLRPQTAHLIKAAAYINKYRVADWNSVFEAEIPGFISVHWRERDAELQEKALQQLRADGFLADYSDEELLTFNLLAFWQIPREAASNRTA